MALKRFELDHDLAFAYFKENLEGTNTISSALMSIIDFKKGKFFTWLRSDINNQHIHEFKIGGTISYVRKWAQTMILDNLLQDSEIYCIFDDSTSSLPDMRKDDLFINYGLIYKNEVYYFLNKNTATVQNVTDCFYASNAIWHSLCILIRTNFKAPHDRKLSQENIREFCENAELILVGAYDAEGYVFWGRKQV